ncbi:MAG: tRNA pseudouridine(55) synthase TruB [Rhodanobacter sp.]|jgi:tRNA pseudouridine55 synthase|nr:tRNA pseudouridine(55) synthase TruB [Rhodanobacter sp.]
MSYEKTLWRTVDGLLLLDKPRAMSSNQALQRARHLFRAHKGGHTGSLDPLATGLLPLCLGEATKIAGLLLGSRKAYEATCLLGVTTTTDDAEGQIVEEKPVPALSDADIRTALAAFTGHITQVPPVYCALKQGGEPLYRRARRGEDVTAPMRTVDVYRYELLAHNDDRLHLRVECGSGTYVRSLIRDLGERLGCGAHVTALRRIWVEPFREPHMYTLEMLAELASPDPAALDACLLPLEAGLAGFPQVHLDAAAARRLRQGQTIVIDSLAGVARCAVFGPDGRAVALAQADAAGRLRSLRGFNPA